MYKCDTCGAHFNEPKRVKNGGGDIGEDWNVCPECWSDDFDELRRCASCGSDMADGEMCVHVDVCVDCMRTIAGNARRALQSALTAEDYKIFSEYYELNDKII